MVVIVVVLWTKTCNGQIHIILPQTFIKVSQKKNKVVEIHIMKQTFTLMQL